jgi:hypothetical protein
MKGARLPVFRLAASDPAESGKAAPHLPGFIYYNQLFTKFVTE